MWTEAEQLLLNGTSLQVSLAVEYPEPWRKRFEELKLTDTGRLECQAGDLTFRIQKSTRNII